MTARQRAHEVRELRGAARDLKQRGNIPIAVFLGAGASKAFGYPLTSELLPEIVKLINSARFLHIDDKKRAARQRRQLRDCLLSLLPGESRRRNNLPLVTSLLSILDYSVATGQSVIAGRSIDYIRESRRLIEHAVLAVIAEEEQFSRRAERLIVRFARLLKSLRKNGRGRPLAVITTNYDMAADETAFEAAGIGVAGYYWIEEDIAERVDFGFRWLRAQKRLVSCPRPAAPTACLLKLHGSTNWLRCSTCDNIYINHTGSIWQEAFRSEVDDANSCHCSKAKLETQIVSPSFVRDMREPNLLGTWKTALDVLREAAEWVIVGYSFPEEDLGVRALFTRAYGSRRKPPHITVVQRDQSALPRYSAFFDPRPHALRYCTGGLERFVDAWESV